MVRITILAVAEGQSTEPCTTQLVFNGKTFVRPDTPAKAPAFNWCKLSRYEG